MGRLFCNCQLMGFLHIPPAAIKHRVLHHALSTWSWTTDSTRYDKIPVVIAQLFLAVLHTSTQKSWLLFKGSSAYAPFLPALSRCSIQFLWALRMYVEMPCRENALLKWWLSARDLPAESASFTRWMSQGKGEFVKAAKERGILYPQKWFICSRYTVRSLLSWLPVTEMFTWGKKVFLSLSETQGKKKTLNY